MELKLRMLERIDLEIKKASRLSEVIDKQPRTTGN